MGNPFLIISIIVIVEIIIFLLILNHYKNIKKNKTKANNPISISQTINLENEIKEEDKKDNDVNLINVSNNEKDKYSKEDLGYIDNNDKEKSTDDEDYFSYEENNINDVLEDNNVKEEKPRIVIDEMPKNISLRSERSNKALLSDPANWNKNNPKLSAPKIIIGNQTSDEDNTNFKNKYKYSYDEMEYIRQEYKEAYEMRMKFVIAIIFIFFIGLPYLRACIALNKVNRNMVSSVREVQDIKSSNQINSKGQFSYTLSGAIKNRFEEVKEQMGVDETYKELEKTRGANKEQKNYKNINDYNKVKNSISYRADEDKRAKLYERFQNALRKSREKK